MLRFYLYVKVLGSSMLWFHLYVMVLSQLLTSISIYFSLYLTSICISKYILRSKYVFDIFCAKKFSSSRSWDPSFPKIQLFKGKELKKKKEIIVVERQKEKRNKEKPKERGQR